MARGKSDDLLRHTQAFCSVGSDVLGTPLYVFHQRPALLVQTCLQGPLLSSSTMPTSVQAPESVLTASISAGYHGLIRTCPGMLQPYGLER